MSKVLFIDQYADLGGGQRILMDVIRYFLAEGMECSVAVPGEGVFTEMLRAEGILVHQLSMPSMNAGNKTLLDRLRFVPHSLRVATEIRAIAAEWGADLLFCNGPRCTLATVLAARRLRTPVVAAVHLIFKGAERRILEWCFRQPLVQGVTFCSNLAARPFEAVVDQDRALIGNWVSPHFEDAPATPGAKKIFEIPSGQLAVGVVGRICPNKGQRLFLQAMLDVLPTNPEIRLILAGGADFEDPSEELGLRALVKEKRLSHRVSFLGPVTNTIALLDSLDILVVPSVWEEPFGLVAVEGMARGLPVVATRSGGLMEIVEDGQTGILVDKSPESIREAVLELVHRPVRRSEMGALGRSRVSDCYSAQPRLEAIRKLAFRAMGLTGTKIAKEESVPHRAGQG
jgi:glycosyltransferase involved in cell wall biosynthesis